MRGGHIPGAAQHPLGAGGAARTAPSSRSRNCATLYEGKGITKDKDVVAYCRIGERSSHTWFVLTYLLGYPHVRNYDGSLDRVGQPGRRAHRAITP